MRRLDARGRCLLLARDLDRDDEEAIRGRAVVVVEGRQEARGQDGQAARVARLRAEGPGQIELGRQGPPPSRTNCTSRR